MASRKSGNSSKGRTVGPSSDNETISIRKIDNGYIVSRSRWEKDTYKCSDTYTPTKPSFDVAVPKARPKAAAGGNALLGAKAELNK